MVGDANGSTAPLPQPVTAPEHAAQDEQEKQTSGAGQELSPFPTDECRAARIPGSHKKDADITRERLDANG